MDGRDHIDPPHYRAGSAYETIRVMEEWFGVESVVVFCRLNAVKYLSRAGAKEGEPMSRDLAKARWYIDHAAKLAERHGL